MAKRGRLEARIVVPAGGWTVSYTDSQGSGAAVIAAGTYTIKVPKK